MSQISRLIFFIFLFVSVSIYAQDYPQEIQYSLAEIAKKFEKGEYKESILKLNDLEDGMRQEGYRNKKLSGLIEYWKAINYKRLNDYPNALDHFRKAIILKHDAKDLYYEYGQSLYTSEQISKAIRAFRISAKKKFKEAVSWYYVGFLYQREKDYKRAIDAYKKIETIADPEKKEVFQPAMMQLGDIYYILAKQRTRVVETMKKLVIPQYKKALKINEDSRIAFDIRRKIHEIQRIFDIIMFKMRNGRPTIYPPFFARFVQSMTYDDNVTYTPEGTADQTSTDTASIVSNTSFYGKYVMYFGSYLSMAPEIRGSYTHHLERDVSEIVANDSYSYNFAVRNAYEYTAKGKPASFLFDYEYAYTARDNEGTENISFFNKSHTIMLGKRVKLIDIGESILRYKYKTTTNFESENNSINHTVVFEQVIGLGRGKTLLWSNNFDMLRSDTSTNDTNSYTGRFDLILPRIGNLGTPSFGLSAMVTDTLEQSDTRGTEILLNPSFKFAKRVGKKARVTFKIDYFTNSSDDEDFAYKKYITGLDLELLF